MTRFSGARRWLALLLCLICCGCSTGLKLAYNHLDTLASWQLGKLVDLDAPQKQQFKRAFDTFWRWHRGTQLPIYATDLRALAQTLEHAPTEPEIAAAFDLIDHHAETAWRHVESDVAALIANLSDAQVAQFIDHQRMMVEHDERKLNGLSAEQMRKRFFKDHAERYESWLGDLNSAQKQRIERAWMDGLPALSDPNRRRQRSLDDITHFAAVLEQRHQPDFALRLRNLDMDPTLPEETRRETAAREAREKQLSIDIYTRMDDAQRERLRKKLLDFAADCETLSRAGA